MVRLTESVIGGIRLNGTPCWVCSHCGRKYQTKAQARFHEVQVHLNG